MRYHKLLWGVLLLFLPLICSGQEYSTNVTLVDRSDDAITVLSIAMSDKKKDAVDLAVKSAFYTLFYRGISGYTDRGLITKDNQYYVDNFMKSRYPMFVKSFVEVEKTERPPQQKQYKAQIEVTISIKPLIKDLVFEGLMEKPLEDVTMQETEAEIGLPSITVVPYKTDEESYRAILQGDFDRRIAVSKVQDGFNQLGVTTIDFEAKANAVWRTMDFNANSADSDEKRLLLNTGADVYVIVDLQKDISQTEGSRVSLNMKAYETASGNILASRQEWTNRFRTNDLDRLCVYAVEGQLTGFLSDIALNFARSIAQGNSIVLYISKGENSNLHMTSQVGSQNLLLSNVIRRWVRENAQDGRYHLQGMVAEEMVFDDVKMPSKDADGYPMDVAQFGENLLFFLLEEMQVPCEMKLDGKTIYITIK